MRATIRASVAMAVAAGLIIVVAMPEPDWRPVVIAAAMPWLVLALASIQWRRSYTYTAAVDDNQDNVRLVPVYRQAPTIEGVDVRDVRHFLVDAYRTGCWQQRRWVVRRLPSGRRCDKVYHGQMLAVMRRAGIIANSGPRRTGYLAVDLAEAFRRLGL